MIELIDAWFNGQTERNQFRFMWSGKFFPICRCAGHVLGIEDFLCFVRFPAYINSVVLFPVGWYTHLIRRRHYCYTTKFGQPQNCPTSHSTVQSLLGLLERECSAPTVSILFFIFSYLSVSDALEISFDFHRQRSTSAFNALSATSICIQYQEAKRSGFNFLSVRLLLPMHIFEFESTSSLLKLTYCLSSLKAQCFSKYWYNHFLYCSVWALL